MNKLFFSNCDCYVLMHHDYVIQKSSGRRFVEITNDKNEIHRSGNVIPGAMTVSKIILPLEILIPELEIHNVSIKFTNSSIYGEKTKDVFSFQFVNHEQIQINVNTFQSQETVAKTFYQKVIQIPTRAIRGKQF